MNKLKTIENGGFPFVLDDLRWMDLGIRNAFLGIFSAFNSDNGFIVSGCVKTIDTGTVTITEGYIVLSGEIYYLPTQSYSEAVAGEVEIVSIDLSYDVNGNKIFQNGSNNSTYEIRNVKVEKVATPAPVDSIFFLTINKLISDSFNLADSKTIASSEAVNQLRSSLSTLINTKQNWNSAVKFYTGTTLPNHISYQIGDLYYVGATAPYTIYIHIGDNWVSLN